MKKLLAIFLAVIMIFSLTACGTDSDKSQTDNSEKVSVSQNEQNEEGGSFTNSSPYKNDSGETSSVAQNNKTESKTSSVAENNDDSNGYTWRQWLKDYEAWVDEYIVILKKYHENPTDMSILSDYTKMLNELAEWEERTDEMKDEIKDTSEVLEFTSEITRILAKITAATNELVND